METVSKLQLQRTLSIRSCFPELISATQSASIDCNANGSPQYGFQMPPAEMLSPFNPFSDSSSHPSHTEQRNKAIFVPLYQASLVGDWEKAREFFTLHPRAITARITKGLETALHIAAGAKQTKFVEELVTLMKPSDLTLQSKSGNTALCFAAASGITRIAEIMVTYNEELPMVRGSKGVLPLHMAALLGHREMTWFLYSVTCGDVFTKEDLIELLIAVIRSDLFDIALHILKVFYPEIATQRGPNGETALHVLARKQSAFSGKCRLGFWQRCIYSGIHGAISERKVMQSQALELLRCLWNQMLLLLDESEISNLLKNPSRPLFVAAANGNFNFIVELLSSYPDLIWKVDEESRSIFHVAVIYRQEKIFRLIYDIGALKDLITSYKRLDDSNMLHLAAKLAPPDRLGIVSGAALQMQRELLWFKEVEKIVQPLYKEMKNSQGFTPRALFSLEHKKLMKEGERWMKDTASSCMLVATLITTVMFAAILTVPGGNDNDNGIPIFQKKKSFIIFSISDAVALFASVTSILMFLSILTSRYAEDDFQESLPKKLIMGLRTLFFSIASMLIAFTASFFIVMGHNLAWIIIPVALCACVTVTLFAFLQFPLLSDTVRTTYLSGIFSGRHTVNIFQ